jgi:hypothetical protein
VVIALVILACWMGLGGVGAYLARRGSIRDYGKNIYAVPMLVATVVFGPAGLLGSMVAW